MSKYFNSVMVRKFLPRLNLSNDDPFLYRIMGMKRTIYCMVCISPDSKEHITPQGFKNILRRMFLEEFKPRTIVAKIKVKGETEDELKRRLVWEEEDSEEKFPAPTSRACGGHNFTYVPKLPPTLDSKDLKADLPPTLDYKDLKTELPPTLDSKDPKAKLQPILDSKDLKAELPPTLESKNLKAELPPTLDYEDLKAKLPPKLDYEDLRAEFPPKLDSKDPKAELPPTLDSKDLKAELPPTLDYEYLRAEFPPTLNSKDLKAELPPKLDSKDPQAELPPKLDSKDLKAELPPTLDYKDLRAEFSPILDSKDPQAELPPTLDSKDPQAELPPTLVLKGESEVNLKNDSKFEPNSVPKLDSEFVEDNPVQVLHWNPNLWNSSNTNLDTDVATSDSKMAMQSEPYGSAPIRIHQGGETALKMEQAQMKGDIKTNSRAEPSGSKSPKKAKKTKEDDKTDLSSLISTMKSALNSKPSGLEAFQIISGEEIGPSNSKPCGSKSTGPVIKVDGKTSSSETFASGPSDTKVDSKTNPSSETQVSGSSQSYRVSDLPVFSSQEELMQYVREVSDMYTRFQQQKDCHYCAATDPRLDWLLQLKRHLSEDDFNDNSSESKEEIKRGFERFYHSFRQTFQGTTAGDKQKDPKTRTADKFIDHNFFGAMLFGPSCDELATYCLDRLLVGINMILNRSPDTFQSILTSGMNSEAMPSSESDHSMQYTYDVKVELPSDTSSEEKIRPSASDLKGKVTSHLNFFSSDPQTKK
ncbi:hypothetical protein KR074_004180 [Drosophila pseudoananassae]|nr:hypothetical protein KR074_004180 [Drosophila pseudoananassae]